MSHRRMAVVAGVALAAALAGAAGILVTNGRAQDNDGRTETAVSTGTAEVRTADVSARTHVNGTLGYAGTYQVIAPGPGVLTRLPAAGQTIRRGRIVYEVDGKPVVLMYGSRPAWRTLDIGIADGPDVQQLETNLKALGHGDGMTVDRHFSLATHYALRRWQRAAGLTMTGSIPLGRIVFMPDAIRIAGHHLVPGTRMQPGTPVLRGTSDRPAVTMTLSPQQLPSAKVGDPVLVTLPDGATRAGKITQIGAVAVPPSGSDNGANSAGGDTSPEPTVPVTVRMPQAVSGFLDQARVQVAITVEARRGVLTVPVTALNAVAGGQYEVVVVDGGTGRRVPVRTGLFDETAGLVEVSGPDLIEGQQVRVPRDNT
ncbi:peptidoglycan-binding protein [Micromonosporaceae bacterium B7E4]